MNDYTQMAMAGASMAFYSMMAAAAAATSPSASTSALGFHTNVPASEAGGDSRKTNDCDDDDDGDKTESI